MLCGTAISGGECPLWVISGHTEATARPCEQGIRRRSRSSSAVQTSVEECPGQQSLQAPAAKMEVRPSPEWPPEPVPCPLGGHCTLCSNLLISSGHQLHRACVGNHVLRFFRLRILRQDRKDATTIRTISVGWGPGRRVERCDAFSTESRRRAAPSRGLVRYTQLSCQRHNCSRELLLTCSWKSPRQSDNRARREGHRGRFSRRQNHQWRGYARR